MITEAQILSLSNNGTDCVVSIPVFQTINTDWPVEVPAVFSCPPGIYNGYNVGDFVWVAFERDMANLPVVIGKMYKGLEHESSQNGSAIKAGNLIVTGASSLPASTIVTFDDKSTSSIAALVSRIKTLEQNTVEKYQLKLKIKFSHITGSPINTFYLRTKENYKSSFAFIQNLYNAGFTSSQKYLVITNSEYTNNANTNILGFFATYSQDTQSYTLYYVLQNEEQTNNSLPAHILKVDDILEISSIDIRHL